MKNYSLKPTEENVLELLRTNPIQRNPYVFRFAEMLSHMEDDCYSIALNGDWGSGKTFFVKQVKLLLDAANPQSGMPKETRRLIEAQIQTAAWPESYVTVYYDAWSYDNHDDPILSLIYATLQNGQGLDLSSNSGIRILNAATAVFDAVTGENLTALMNGLKGLRSEDKLSAIKKNEDLKEKIREFINLLIEEHGNRLVFFIDELDRCKPDYAIRFLERIKHYFDDERITFVFSVNLTQLQWTVRSYYGNGFDATKYIDKFFDLQISIPRTNSDSFLRDRLHIGTDTVSTMVCHEIVRQFDFSLRQAERYARLIKIVATQFDRYDSIREENKAAIFAANYLVPFLIGLQMYDLKLYHEFLAGTNPGPMLSILANIVVMGCPLFLKRGEEFKPETKEIRAENGETIPVVERLRVIYDALYGRADIWNGRDLTVGQMRFTDRTRAYIDSIVSMLFSEANYNFE